MNRLQVSRPGVQVPAWDCMVHPILLMNSVIRLNLWAVRRKLRSASFDCSSNSAIHIRRSCVFSYHSSWINLPPHVTSALLYYEIRIDEYPKPWSWIAISCKALLNNALTVRIRHIFNKWIYIYNIYIAYIMFGNDLRLSISHTAYMRKNNWKWELHGKRTKFVKSKAKADAT